MILIYSSLLRKTLVFSPNVKGMCFMTPDTYSLHFVIFKKTDLDFCYLLCDRKELT